MPTFLRLAAQGMGSKIMGDVRLQARIKQRYAAVGRGDGSCQGPPRDSEVINEGEICNVQERNKEAEQNVGTEVDGTDETK